MTSPTGTTTSPSDVSEDLRLAVAGALTDLRLANSEAAALVRRLIDHPPTTTYEYVGYLTTVLAVLDVLPVAHRVHGHRVNQRPAPVVPIGVKRADRSPDGCPLSPRELEVVELLTQGATKNEIALALGISRHTVKTHVEHITKALPVRGQCAIVATCLRNGWVA